MGAGFLELVVGYTTAAGGGWVSWTTTGSGGGGGAVEVGAGGDGSGVGVDEVDVVGNSCAPGPYMVAVWPSVTYTVVHSVTISVSYARFSTGDAIANRAPEAARSIEDFILPG